MPASKAEQVLDALKALLETVPDAVVERNSVLPEKVPDGGLIILRDGDPGEPEQALGGFGNAYYQHAVEIEVYVEEGPGRQQPKLRRLGAERALHDRSADQRPIGWHRNQAPVPVRQLEHRRPHSLAFVRHHAEPA